MAIKDLIKDKDRKEKANIKGLEIAKVDFKGEHTNAKYPKIKIDIISIEAIEGGVQVLAKGWKDGKQLGFGKDGSVEIEKFNIYNPPILVEDTNGDIVRSSVDSETGETVTRKLKEDPSEAIRQTIAHNVSLVGKENTTITKGKVGNTTSTFYSIVDGDGTIFSGTGAYSQAGFDAQHDLATGSSVERGANALISVYYSPSENRTRIRRGFLPFDTSDIPDGDTIDSATVSLDGYMKDNDATTDSTWSWLNVVQTTQNDTSNLVVADYDTCGAVDNPTEGATRIAYSALPQTIGARAYTDWTLNATGLTWIVKTGVSKLGMRDGMDALDHWVSGLTGFDKYNAIDMVYSDAAGTSQDPKLVVVHSAPAPPADKVRTKVTRTLIY